MATPEPTLAEQARQMSLVNRNEPVPNFTSLVSSGYLKLDKALGGILPGGVPPGYKEEVISTSMTPAAGVILPNKTPERTAQEALAMSRWNEAYSQMNAGQKAEADLYKATFDRNLANIQNYAQAHSSEIYRAFSGDYGQPGTKEGAFGLLKQAPQDQAAANELKRMFLDAVGPEQGAVAWKDFKTDFQKAIEVEYSKFPELPKGVPQYAFTPIAKGTIPAYIPTPRMVGKETIGAPSQLIRPISSEPQFISSVFPSLIKYRQDILTPKTFMAEPGATTRIIQATPESIMRTKAFGEKPILKEFKPGYPNYLIAGLIPKTDIELASMGTLGLLGAGALATYPTLASSAFTGLGGYSGYKYLTSKPSIDMTPEEFQDQKASYATGTIGLLGLTKLSEFSLFGKKPYQFIPSEELTKLVEPFSRQRATVMLKNQYGEYILGEAKSGDLISIGGKIEKWQTPRTAAIAELGQETGLKLKDISDFGFHSKVVTPEETFHIFTGTVKDSSKIIPASDIKRIVAVSPKNIFLRDVTGQTSLQPNSRIVPFKGNVRSYEAGIINYLETGTKPTWLALDTPQGTAFLGIQSRYDIPFSSQREYLGKRLFLTHGTPSPAVLKMTRLGKQKMFVVEGGLTQRGQAKGLYLQPPPIPKKSFGYIGMSYLPIKNSQEGLGLKIGFPKRTSFLFKEKASGAISPTPKTYSGMEAELLVKPGSEIATSGPFKIASVGLKRVFLQPVKIVKQGLGNIPISDFPSEGYRYITPFQIASIPPSIPRTPKTPPSISFSNILSSKKAVPSKVTLSITNPSVTRLSPSVKAASLDIQPVSKRITQDFISIPPSIPRTPKTPPSIPPSIPRTPKTPPSIPPSIPRNSRIKKFKQKSETKNLQGFYVLTMKRKRPVLITPKPLSKAQALGFGVSYTKKTERASFKLVPTKKTPVKIAVKPMSEIQVWQAGYRPPVRKGRTMPSNLTYIQRRPTRMGTRKEVVAIQSYKRGKSIW